MILTEKRPDDEDRIGLTFNRLTIIERGECPRRDVAETYIRQTWYRCQCACSAFTVQPWYHIRIGRVKSCGCLKRELGPRNLPDRKYLRTLIEIDLDAGLIALSKATRRPKTALLNEAVRAYVNVRLRRISAATAVS